MSKQGNGKSSMGSMKREPINHTGNVSGVANLGNMVGTRMAVAPVEGRQFSNPPIKSGHTYPKGSQGKH